MIGAQESRETMFHSFEGLPNELRKSIKERTCLNCETKLTDNTRIHYVTLDKEVLWWHDRSCSRDRFAN